MVKSIGHFATNAFQALRGITFRNGGMILLMDEILHQLIGSFSHYL